MKLRFTLLGLLSLLAVSCSYEESFVLDDNDGNSAAEFYATIDEQPNADTKVYADDQLRVLWNADDRVTIFNKNTYNQQYRFTGQEGANAGGFRKVQSDDEFITSEPLDLIYSVYPYQETTYINYDETISFVLPAEQTYKDSSFGIGANTMVSKTADNQLRFKNVGGYLSLKFYGEGVSVSSITLKGNNGELLAGKCSIDMSSGLPVLTMDDGKATDTITLVCDPVVDLGNSSSEAIAFWFVLPPVTFTKGITVTVTTSDGGVFEKTTSNKLEIGRSAITRLGALEVVPEYVQLNNIMYYTSADGEIVIPFAADSFGARIINNEYVDGRGILTFDADVTCIGEMAYYSRHSLTSIIIPDSVTRIEQSAFNDCWGLISIVIPESVTSVGEGAFYNCNSLTDIVIPESITSIEQYVFCECDGLTSIVIPNAVYSIGEKAFEACRSLTSVVMNSTTPPAGASKMFANTNNCPIYVPAESVEAYKTAQYWSDYADRIYAIGIPMAVDLGLSVKWASFNLGATTPEEYGDYFAWGEVEPKMSYTWETYKWCEGTNTSITKYNSSESHGIVDNKTILDPDDDAATVILGAGWRMPTSDEIDEIISTNNCKWEWTSLNGISGYKVTSRIDGFTNNWIFLPASGYRSGASRKTVSTQAWYYSSSCHFYPHGIHFFHNGSIYHFTAGMRKEGCTIRPVSD